MSKLISITNVGKTFILDSVKINTGETATVNRNSLLNLNAVLDIAVIIGDKHD